MSVEQHGRTAKDRFESQICTTPEGSECRRAIEKLEEIVLDGLRHGFFEFTVACEITKGDKRRLVIKAGVSHKYVIPPEELEDSK